LKRHAVQTAAASVRLREDVEEVVSARNAPVEHERKLSVSRLSC